MSDDHLKVTTKVPKLPEYDGELLNLFDQNNPDIGLFNIVDDELIRLAGSKLNYYKFLETGYDEVYMEVRNKVLSQEPITVWGHYDPTVIEENLTQFGLELTNDQVFVFNKTYIESQIGRPPKEGDVIQPLFQNMKFKIHEVQEDSFESFGVFHFNCYATLLRDSDDVQNTPLKDVSPDVLSYGGGEDATS